MDYSSYYSYLIVKGKCCFSSRHTVTHDQYQQLKLCTTSKFNLSKLTPELKIIKILSITRIIEYKNYVKENGIISTFC